MGALPLSLCPRGDTRGHLPLLPSPAAPILSRPRGCPGAAEEQGGSRRERRELFNRSSEDSPRALFKLLIMIHVCDNINLIIKELCRKH